jgi:LmbE family N-acetylglucosaminyl deacetylase
MATLVCFHAHPDDESIATGGTMAKAVRDGHRVVLVVATRGEHGEVDDGVLAPDEQLWERRVEETERSAKVLGVHRVEFLGYVDSGMIGTPENDLPGSFWTADVDEAAERLAAILREEHADVLTVYDSDGGYGHPDHIQVHRVGIRAGELAETPRVFESTMNRDHIMRLMALAGQDLGEEAPGEIEVSTFGRPEDVITTTVDVSDFVDTKRRSMQAHSSQITDSSFFLSMPEEQFRSAFGQEWFVRRDVPSDHRDDDLFAELP